MTCTSRAEPSPSTAGAPEPPIQVTYYHRKPQAVGNYSIEAIFAGVREQLTWAIRPRVSVGRFFSRGLLRRLYLCAEALVRQGEVNHVTGDISFVGLLLSKRKTVQTIHDCVGVTRSRGLKRELLRLFWVALPARRAAYVTVVSEATRAQVLALTPGCPPEKVVVIPNAISARFQPWPKPFDTGCPRILQLGTASNKNLPRLVEALRGLPCHLDVIGRKVREYEVLLERSGLRYSYRSDLSDGEILDAYRAADIVALASTYEGFGMPILEAQAVGRPVITSDVHSMPEVAGEGACLVNPFDPADIRRGIDRIIQDAAYRDALLARGTNNLRRFDPDRIAEAYLSIYRRIAGR